MLETDAQYTGVLNLLTIKLKKYRKPKLRLHRIYETICRQSLESYLPEPSYDEFKNMFESNFIETPMFPNKQFVLEEQGFLDVKRRYPYHIYSVQLQKKVSKRKV